MKNVLDLIDDLQRRIDSYRPFSGETLGIWQEKLRVDWTYNSNAIEGNTLTYGETAFFLREGLTSEGKPLKDYVEAKNHAEAIDWLHEIIRGKRPFTEGFVKELHALLMRDIHFTYARGAGGKLIQKPLMPGVYKSQPNHVLTISGRIHYYTDPLHVKDKMEELLKWYHGTTVHPVEKAAIFHYRFVAIHPFDDGNGRMARLLMNLILMRDGYPPCVIKKEHRKTYLDALEIGDAKKDFKPFVEFIGRELMSTQEMMLDVITGNVKNIDGTPGRILNKEERHRMILAMLRIESLSIGQIWERLPQFKRPTLKSDLSFLVNAKKINRKGMGKGTLYGAVTTRKIS